MTKKIPSVVLGILALTLSAFAFYDSVQSSKDECCSSAEAGSEAHECCK